MTRDPAVASRRLLAGLLLLISLLGAVVIGWRAAGGRWFVVSTASMGRAAPVGSLLVTRPARVADVRTGDVVTFRSPTGVVYSHRVVGRDHGSLVTQGDLNPVPDSWRTPQSRLVGRVGAIVPGLGWVVRGIPLGLVVLGSCWVLGALARPRWRSVLRLTGVSMAVAVGTFVLHPWVGLEQTGTREAGDRLGLRTVSTGVMPVRVRAVHSSAVGAPVRLRDGEAGTVWVRRSAGATKVEVAAVPDLTAGWWAAVVLLCLAPLGLSLAVGVHADADADQDRESVP